MRKTKIATKKVIEHDRLCDATEVGLRDIIVKDLLTASEKKDYYSESIAKGFDKFNIYIDKTEENPSVKFNLSVDGEPASTVSSDFQMYILSGNSNEQGTGPLLVNGSVDTTVPDTIVQFEMPIDKDKNAFSYHKDGYSYANYAIYAVRTSGSKILMAKGKIIMTDILFDLTETVGA